MVEDAGITQQVEADRVLLALEPHWSPDGLKTSVQNLGSTHRPEKKGERNRGGKKRRGGGGIHALSRFYIGNKQIFKFHHLL